MTECSVQSSRSSGDGGRGAGGKHAVIVLETLPLLIHNNAYLLLC